MRKKWKGRESRETTQDLVELLSGDLCRRELVEELEDEARAEARAEKLGRESNQRAYPCLERQWKPER